MFLLKQHGIKNRLVQSAETKMLLTQHCAHMHCFRIHAMSSSKKKTEDPVTFFSSAEGAPLRLDCNMWPQNFGTGQLGGDGCYF